MRSTFLALVAVAGLIATPAQAQRAGQGWSVLGATSIGDGAMALNAQFGYPGLSAEFLAGLGSVDVGFRGTYNYAFEGWTARYSQRNGLKGQALLRLNVLRGQRVNIGLRFEPGIFAYFTSNRTDTALTLPVGITLGIPVSSALNLALTMDVPFYVLWTNGRGAWNPLIDEGVYIPLLFGAGAEYFVDRNLALTAQMKMGPTLRPDGGALFTLQFLFGVAVKF
jgi:hypothetical protein